MKNTLIRGIDFGRIMGASGVQGIFGEGYPYHKKYKKLFGKRFTFDGVTFVAKTVTLHPRPGNMELEQDGLTPKEKLPKCIKWNFFAGAALNAVGLSNFGARFYFDKGRWQERKKPFFLSFMSVAGTREQRITESTGFIRMTREYLPDFRAPIGIQLNYSCPNTGHAQSELLSEISEVLDSTGDIPEVAIVLKFNALIPVSKAIEVSAHKRCDALCVSNTIPWGQLPEEIYWRGLFGSEVSPLAHLGGGGLSGKPITKIVQRWVAEYDRSHPLKPLCGGGGIMRATNAKTLFDYKSVNSVFIGTAAMLRPWRLRSIIRQARSVQ